MGFIPYSIHAQLSIKIPPTELLHMYIYQVAICIPISYIVTYPVHSRPVHTIYTCSYIPWLAKDMVLTNMSPGIRTIQSLNHVSVHPYM